MAKYEVTLTFSTTERIVVTASSATDAIEQAKRESREMRNPDRYLITEVDSRRITEVDSRKIS